MPQSNGWTPVEEPKGWTPVQESASSSVSPIPPPAVKPFVPPMHKSYLLGDPNENPEGPEGKLTNQIGQIARDQMQGLYSVSAPHIARQLYNKFTGQPHQLEDVPGNATLMMIGSMAGGEPVPEGTMQPRIASPKPVEALSERVSRTLEGSKTARVASHIPVIGKPIRMLRGISSDLADLAQQKRASMETPPEPPSPGWDMANRQQWWRDRGGAIASDRPGTHARVGSPQPVQGAIPRPAKVATPSASSTATGSQVAEPDIEQVVRTRSIATPEEKPMPNMVPDAERASTIIPREANEAIGQRIAGRGETKANIEKGEPRIAKPSEVQQQLERALGNEPVKIKPGVPIRNQIATPSGHTEVESSALHSYKYDPNTREFEAHMKGGNTTYVYGDVRPEDVQAFEGAESKGKALQGIRSNPLVAKIVNGKRVSVRPVGPRVASPNEQDLTPILKQSVEAAKKKPH